MRTKALSTLVHTTLVGVGDRQARKAAQLVVDAIGIGSVTPLAGVGGNGAAGAALDLSTLTASGSRLVRVEVGGDTNIRFADAAGAAVSLTLWHAGLQAGTGRTFLLDQSIVSMTGWGVAGAWNYVVYPIDEVG